MYQFVSVRSFHTVNPITLLHMVSFQSFLQKSTGLGSTQFLHMKLTWVLGGGNLGSLDLDECIIPCLLITFPTTKHNPGYVGVRYLGPLLQNLDLSLFQLLCPFCIENSKINSELKMQVIGNWIQEKNWCTTPIAVKKKKKSMCIMGPVNCLQLITGYFYEGPGGLP